MEASRLHAYERQPVLEVAFEPGISSTCPPTSPPDATTDIDAGRIRGGAVLVV